MRFNEQFIVVEDSYTDKNNPTFLVIDIETCKVVGHGKKLDTHYLYEVTLPIIELKSKIDELRTRLEKLEQSSKKRKDHPWSLGEWINLSTFLNENCESNSIAGQVITNGQLQIWIKSSDGDTTEKAQKIMDLLNKDSD